MTGAFGTLASSLQGSDKVDASEKKGAIGLPGFLSSGMQKITMPKVSGTLRSLHILFGRLPLFGHARRIDILRSVSLSSLGSAEHSDPHLNRVLFRTGVTARFCQGVSLVTLFFFISIIFLGGSVEP